MNERQGVEKGSVIYVLCIRNLSVSMCLYREMANDVYLPGLFLFAPGFKGGVAMKFMEELCSRIQFTNS